jgi:hypothetical protein
VGRKSDECFDGNHSQCDGTNLNNPMLCECWCHDEDDSDDDLDDEGA